MKVRVLVVEGDDDYRALLRLALEGDERLDVEAEASDAVGGAAHAFDCQPDVIVVGTRLRGGDGFAALPGLRAASPTSAIVLLSGQPRAELAPAAFAAGALGCLTKDTRASRLPEELLALLGLMGLVDEVLHEAWTSLDEDVRSAGAARSFVAEALRECWDQELTASVSLLVSELVTNAVMHARSAPEVRVTLVAGRVRVEVHDSSDRLPASRTASENDVSGRGLAILDRLTRAWGVRPSPGGGKTVWFELDRSNGPDLVAV